MAVNISPATALGFSRKDQSVLGHFQKLTKVQQAHLPTLSNEPSL